ncbi:MAG: hypothetical protein HN802_04850 [Candidatus Jacksonbacteria bacterium]|jgi:hypothetical protein|nr:hypothetical protein [Candidatus Jacksonbacteria bacterium]
MAYKRKTLADKQEGIVETPPKKTPPKKVATKKAVVKKSGSSHIVMFREADNKLANVHPDEVENYKLGDWVVKL